MKKFNTGLLIVTNHPKKKLVAITRIRTATSVDNKIEQYPGAVTITLQTTSEDKNYREQEELLQTALGNELKLYEILTHIPLVTIGVRIKRNNTGMTTYFAIFMPWNSIEYKIVDSKNVFRFLTLKECEQIIHVCKIEDKLVRPIDPTVNSCYLDEKRAFIRALTHPDIVKKFIQTP